MPIDSSATLIVTLQRLRLLSPAQMEEAARMQARTPEPRAFAKDLLQRGLLTPYQINQVFKDEGAGLVLGQYVLLERIGAGGMGAVFKARHQRLERLVALKLIRKERLTGPEAIQRFQREARAAARLAHPNIVAVYDADEVNGTHFLAMELVEGTDLHKLVKRNGPLPVTQACDHVRQAALGLQHAHEKGLVHRDIKPANLFLTAQGGVVKVLDMGLARLHGPVAESSDGTEAMTREGAVMGTPDFIAPEQAVSSHTVDIRADLYSLGCTLYYLLTGKPPFPGGSLAEKLIKHQMAEPQPVEQRRPDVPPAVGAVVRKLMAKRPEQRYQTPAELVLALAAVGGGLPVATPVYPQAIPVAAEMQSELNTVGTGGLAGPVPLDETVPYAGVAPPGSPLRPSARRLGLSAAKYFGRLVKFLFVPRSRARTELLRVGAGWVTLVAVVLLLWPSGHSHNPDDPLSPDGTRGSPIENWVPPERTSFEKLVLKLPDEIQGTLGDDWGRSWAGFRCVAITSDGKLVATGGYDNLIRLWDGKTLKLTGILRDHAFQVIDLAFSPDGKKLASASEGEDTRVWLWDLKTGTNVRLIGHGNTIVTHLTFSMDSKKLLSAGQDQAIQWDATTGQRLRTLDLAANLLCVALSPDGRHVLSAHKDKTLRLWDLEAEKEVRKVPGHTQLINGVAFSPDGSRAVSVSTEEKGLRLWKVDTGDAITAVTGRPEYLGLVFSPRGDRLAFPVGGSVYLLDALGLSQVASSSGSFGAFYRDGRALTVTGNTLQRWDLETGVQIQYPKGHTAAVSSVAFSPKGDYLLSGSHDGNVTLWNLNDKRKVGGFSHGLNVYSVAISPNGKHAFAGGPSHADGPDGKALRLWEILESVTAFSAYTPSGQFARASSVAFSADSRLALSGGYVPEPGATELQLWDVEKRVRVRSFENVGEGINCVAFLPPDSKQAVSGGANKLVRLWDVATGKESRTLPREHTGLIQSVACSPDGRHVLSGGADGTVRLWDLQESKPQGQVMEDSPANVSCVAFAPDGKTMAASGHDGRIRLWDAATRKVRWRTQLPGAVLGIAFAPDSRYLATANGNGTVYILKIQDK